MLQMNLYLSYVEYLKLVKRIIVESEVTDLGSMRNWLDVSTVV